MSLVVRALPTNGRFSKHIESIRTMCQARVTHDYRSEGNTEINLKVGSQVRVVHKFESGWWLGESGGHLGHFPAAFVQELEAPPSVSPRSVSPPPTESGDPKRRQQAIQEIYDTEKSYLESLEVLFDVWLRPLQLRGMLKEDEFRGMFQGLDAIKDCSQKLVTELRGQLEQSSSQLGDIFLALKDQIRVVLLPYVLQYDNSQNTYNKLIKNNTKFATFVKDTSKHERCAGRDLSTFLIMPIQRLPRYGLLLGELLKYLSESSAEYASISSAYSAIRETTEQVNSTKGNSAQANDVKRIWDLLEPQPPDLLEPHRRFRMEGEVWFYEKKKLHPRYIFLFNDVFLVTSKDGDKKKQNLLIWVNLKSIVLDTKQSWSTDEFPLNSDMQSRVNCSFMVHTTKKSLLFFAFTQASYSQWTTAIQTALTELLEPEKDHLNRKLSPISLTSS